MPLDGGLSGFNLVRISSRGHVAVEYVPTAGKM